MVEEIADYCQDCTRRRQSIDGVNAVDFETSVHGLIEVGDATVNGREHVRYVCPICGAMWTVFTTEDVTQQASFIVRGWMLNG
jgi:hypothetical protein